jgi:hypothetical protein
MLDKLERLPASAERDRMLREVRARVVDVDTGVEPSALAPLSDEKSTPPADPAPRLRRAARPVARTPVDEARRPRTTARREPAEPPAAGAGDRLGVAPDELLSLDEAWLPPGEARTELVPAWRRGLRG